MSGLPEIPAEYAYVTAGASARGQSHRMKVHVTLRDPDHGFPMRSGVLCGAKPASGIKEVDQSVVRRSLDDLCPKCEAKLDKQFGPSTVHEEHESTTDGASPVDQADAVRRIFQTAGVELSKLGVGWRTEVHPPAVTLTAFPEILEMPRALPDPIPPGNRPRGPRPDVVLVDDDPAALP